MDRMSHKCIIIIIKKYNLHAVGTLKRREKRANNFFLIILAKTDIKP